MPTENSHKPAEQAEEQIIRNILSGVYPPNSNLPAERQLAVTLGVTRPTLREVLQRLARNGWLEIHHGRSTRVRDYLSEGSLSVLRSAGPDERFAASLQELRLLLAPVYTRQAIEKNGADVSMLVQSLAELPEDSAGTALADWRLHYGLAVLSGNPLFALILKDLEGFSETVMGQVFTTPELCQKVRTAYRMIGKAARAGEPDAAEAIMRRTLQDCMHV
jgi:GntR family negative regulator for fad regulon and positive regulator of fabA